MQFTLLGDRFVLKFLKKLDYILLSITFMLMPVTGIPLPFISYGVSSLLSNMIGIGMVMEIVIRNKSRKNIS